MRAIAGIIAAAIVASGSAAQSPAIGTIVLYRTASVVGYAVACPIRYKGSEVVELGRGKFARWIVPPGRYLLSNKSSSVEVTVDPGETRFVRCAVEDSGGFVRRANLRIVDQETFEQHSADYREKAITLASGS